MPTKINEYYAWVCVHADGSEGIPAGINDIFPDYVIPMVGWTRERMEQFRKQAAGIVKEHGVTMKLVKFSTITVLDEIKPGLGV